MIYASNFQLFVLSRNLLICNCISFLSTMLFYIIMALVIYKSSIVAAKDSPDASSLKEGMMLLSELRDQYSLDRQLRKASAEDAPSSSAVTSHEELSPQSQRSYRVSDGGRELGGRNEGQCQDNKGETASLFSERHFSRNTLGLIGKSSTKPGREPNGGALTVATSNSGRQSSSQKRHASLAEQDWVASQGDWYMCEGLLSVFLNNNHSRQQIFYKK